jgi:hypothetical protein
MAFAVPAVIGLYELLIAAGVLTAGIAVTAISVESLLKNSSSLPAKMRLWVTDNSATLAQEMKKEEEREITPFTAPPAFTAETHNNWKIFIKNGTTEAWSPDLLHCNHFEVFTSKKMIEKKKIDRVVSLDGRRLK